MILKTSYKYTGGHDIKVEIYKNKGRYVAISYFEGRKHRHYYFYRYKDSKNSLWEMMYDVRKDKNLS